MAAGTFALSAVGCATTPYRPKAVGGKHYELINDKFCLGEVNQDNSRHQAKGVENFGDKYYHVQTKLGEALFSHEKSLEKNYYEIENEEIYGMTSTQSGEGGLYFVENAKDKNGKLIDSVEIDPCTRMAEVNKRLKIVDEKDNLKIFHTTEQDTLFNIGFFTAIPGNPRYAIKVEKEKRNNPNFYDFYLIPVHKSNIVTNRKGEITIENIDNVYRPTFKCWSQIEEAISKLSPEEQEQTEKQLKPVGLPLESIKAKHKYRE